MRTDNQRVAFFNPCPDLDGKIGVCDQLRKLSARDFSMAQKRWADENTLPISKWRLIEIIRKSYDATIPLAEQIKIIISQIKSKSVVGDYGRFASLITSAELIPCDETVIYSPNDKNESNLPPEKYKHSVTEKVNPLVTALGGSQEAWSRYLEDKNLSAQAEVFYHKHYDELESTLNKLRFFDKFETFYTPNRMQMLTVTMPDGTEQKLPVFDSNASQIQGGQWLFSAPTGLPNEGYVEHILTQIGRVSQALSRKQDDAPCSFQGMSEASQAFINSVDSLSDFTGRSREAPVSAPNKKIPEKRSKSAMFTHRSESTESLLTAPSKKVVRSLKVDESKQWIMEEKPEFVFLLGSTLDSSFVFFQNSRDIASVPTHYHCYAVKRDKILARNGVSYSIPLFQAAVEKSIFTTDASDVPIKFEKMNWAATCYRLTVPLNTTSNAKFLIAQALRDLQDTALSKNANVSFTYITTHDGDEFHFYIGFRKCIPKNSMPNKLASENNLQPPDNGCLEFVGINTMKTKSAFKAYEKLYSQNPIFAKALFLEIQKESLQIICPSEEDIDSFEKNACNIFNAMRFDSLSSFIPRNAP